MKKFKLFLLPLLLLAGCGSKSYKEGEKVWSSENLQVMCSHNGNIVYVRDSDTEIMYICNLVQGGYSISPYYNSKGEPMKYSEFKVVHIDKYHK